MSVKNFIPEIWSSKFEEDLERKLVFAEDCNRAHEGEAKKPGDVIRILGLGDVELGSWTDGNLHQLSRLDEIQGTTMAMPINQIKYFRFFVDDLDKRQAEGGSGLLSKYMGKAKDAVASAQDAYIAALAADPSIEKVTKSTAVSASNILGYIDEAVLKLYENDVDPNTKIVLTAPFWFVQVLRTAYVDLDTDNSEMLRNGKVGMYGNITIKASNNVYNDTTYDNILVRTQDAISFVNPYTHVESYRPDDYFQDVVKGYSLFDAKVTQPKQVINLQVKK